MRQGDTCFSTPLESLSSQINSTDLSLSSSTMGHNSIPQHPFQDSPGFLNDEKTMDHTIATEPTQYSDLGAVGMQEEEDDTTTIQSFDSLTGAGLLNLTDDYDENHTMTRTADNVYLPILSPVQNNGAAGTSSVCSVSTAPSTDETLSPGPDLALHSYDQASRSMLGPARHHHRRVPSWEVSPRSQQQMTGGRVSPAPFHLPPSLGHAGWSNAGVPNQTSNVPFDNSIQNYSQGARLSANAHHWNHHIGRSESTLPFLPQGSGRSLEPSSPRGLLYRHQVNPNNFAYSAQQMRKPYNQPPLPPSAVNTPPRMHVNERIPRSPGPNSALAMGHTPHRSMQTQQGIGAVSGGGSSRSSSEVLKTLLRKKACLYEPDTSRAVALVTWLVGRELALEFGFFSRQQLQAGVHACVADKIESGVITRTKVNRCMQIILNSCFHYIIPRSDGSEESGETMKVAFAKEMKNDAFLLSVLPLPWNDIVIDRENILAACEEEMELQRHPKKFETPQSSPRFSSVQAMGSPGGVESLEGDSDGKRAVLLCFNENVRSAEEVFRCHNEFIRDTAHACHLQLSSNEWRVFFGREASSTRYLWGNVGIPVPYLEDHGPQHTDALGILVKEEVGAFRTTWCSKRYDHEHDLCGFGHAEVNGGWLRRNPLLHEYADEMCQHISCVRINTGTVVQHVIINKCRQGTDCSFAHSREEMIYHPRRYKQKTCLSLGRQGGCALGDVCPSFHPIETYRFPKKADSRSARFSRPAPSMDKGATASPPGSPILYVSPAPISSYEHHLVLPGLQCLFRKNCAVSHANLMKSSGDKSGGTTLYYNCLGDDVVKMSPEAAVAKDALIICPLAQRP
jgi:hypothetical protein